MPAQTLLIVAGLTMLALVGLLLRRIHFVRMRGRIPIRIHIGGTRGKSSTTRMIAGALRANGIATIAKTTGADVLIVLPDGSEQPWQRWGPASIAEQFAFIRLGARSKAQALVLECMAVRHDLIWASERLIVNASIAVITNTRADHLEEGEAAKAVLGLIPWNGTIVVSAETMTPLLLDAAAKRRSRVISVQTGGLSPDAANAAIARQVCEIVGIAIHQFESTLVATEREPGAFFVKDFAIDGKSVRFANAFACNDTGSLAMLLDARTRPGDQLVMLLNHRNDRPLRSLQFLDFFAKRTDTPHLVIVNGCAWLRRAAARRGLSFTTFAPPRDLAATPCALVALVPPNAFVWGVGNFHGAGAAIAQAIRKA